MTVIAVDALVTGRTHLMRIAKGLTAERSLERAALETLLDDFGPTLHRRRNRTPRVLPWSC